MAEPTKKGRQGFASMTPEQRRAISRKGGASVPGAKRSFYLNRALATEAGRKGGTVGHGGGRPAKSDREG